jgi:O-antigen/teichoic acid export membrane protein
MSMPKRLYARFRESRGFRRDMAVLASGTAISQLIVVLAAPVITRLYSPSDFGMLAVYSATVGLGGALATFQYHQAIPLPKERGTMAGIFALCLISIALVSLVVALCLWQFGLRALTWINAEQLHPFVWLVPLGMAGAALYETTSSYAIRQKAFARIAGTRLSQSVSQSGTQIVSGLAGMGSAGLLIGQFFGQAMGSASLGALAWRQDRGAFLQLRFQNVVATARRYRRFPLFSTWGALLNVLSLQAPVILLSYFFGAAVTGLFALTQQVLLMPVALVSKSASQAFTAVAVDANREDRIAEVATGLFGQMSLLGIPLAVAVFLVAPEGFATLFGDEWRVSGLYAQWLSAWLLLTFLTLPLSPLIAILNQQSTGAVFQLALLTGRVGAIVIGGLSLDPMLAITLFAIVGAVLRAVFLVWLLRIARTSLRCVIPHLLDALRFATVANLPLAISKFAGFSDYLTVSIAVLSATVAAAWLVLRNSTSTTTWVGRESE